MDEKKVERMTNKNTDITKQKELQKPLLYTIVILTIIYNSGSVWITINNKVGFALMIISMFVLYLYKPSFKFKTDFDALSLYMLISILAIFISLFINRNYIYIDNNIRYIIIIIFSYLFVINIDHKEFIEYYSKIMTILVSLSLIPFYLINTFNLDILKYLPLIKNVNGVEYYNGLIFYYYTYSQKRNMGVFWEPSIFSSFIIIALLYELIYRKTSKIKIIILFIGLISTGSTGGFLLFPIIVLIVLFRNLGGINRRILQIFIAVAGVWTYFNTKIVLELLNKISPLVFGKFLRANSDSVFDRSNSPLANIELFLQNPVFGNGLGRVDDLYSTFHISQTSTSTYYLATFGVLGLLYSLGILYGVFHQKGDKLSEKIFIFLIYILIVNKEPHARILLTHILILYLIKEDTSKEDTSDDDASDEFMRINFMTRRAKKND